MAALHVRSLLSFLFAAAFLTAATPAASHAQGRVTGTVTDSARVPLAGARVTIETTAASATTDEAGRYSIANVPAGTYVLRVQRVGHRPETVSGVAVRSSEETRVDVVLGRTPLQLTGIVISASRRPEKVTEAPATVTRIETSAIDNSVGNSFAGALKDVKGLDYIQIGVTAVAVNARGFNSAFNNRMLMMEDNRIAVLPENGLPVGGFTAIPKLDLAGIEVLVGPGSALYGADASNGVITLQTKDPRAFPGTSAEVAGGSRNFYDAQVRHAGVSGRIGYKIAAEYQAADDWENHNMYAPIATGGTPSPELNANFHTNVMRGTGALVYYFQNNGRLEFNAGASKSNALGMTNVGRNQLIDWQYRHAQLKYSNSNWFAQAYTTQSLSGDTYQLNGYAQNRRRFPSISEDSVRKLSDFPATGRLMAAEIQNTFALQQVNGARITWGGQFRRDVVSSDRQWLIDRLTGQDIEIDQKGVYGQLEMPIVPMLRGIVAARYDKHESYDGQFSPKAGLLIMPAEDQTFRVTFNRAFKAPTTLQTSFYFPDFAPFVGVFGNPNGYNIRNRPASDPSGVTVRTIAPIEPETNDTWELGYKGVIANKLFVDITGYRSQFDKFLSPLVIIANFATPAAAGGPTYAVDAKTGVQLAGATGGPQIPLTYFNVGQATILGSDIGIRYLLTPTIGISGTASLQKVDTIKTKPGDPVEATSFNSPTSKLNVGMDFARLGHEMLSGGFTVRYVNGYDFISGVNNGHVPTFTTFDFTLGYALPRMRARINLNVQNLFACTGGITEPNGWIASGRRANYTAGRQCGMGRGHQEMLNSPLIGTMAFLGVRVDR
jgi:outer membrane receptor for ferrienterochelin and colicins